MPKTLPADLLDLVRAILAEHPNDTSVEEIGQRIAASVSRRTLERRLAEWVDAGEIHALGSNKGRRYLVAPAAPPRAGETPDILRPEQRSTVVAPGVGNHYPPLPTGGLEAAALIRRPIFERPPVGYRRAFLDAYIPNQTSYLPEAVAKHLREIGRTGASESAGGNLCALNSGSIADRPVMGIEST